MVGEITEPNPNVFLEVGYAWGHKRPTALIIKKGTTPPFDVQDQNLIYYSTIRQAEVALQSVLAGQFQGMT